MTDQPTILIVDDEPRVLDALEAVLAAEFRVLRASNGPGALELLRSEDVAVVLTDYRMPGMTGVEMLRECQAIAPDAVAIPFPDVKEVVARASRTRPRLLVDPEALAQLRELGRTTRREEVDRMRRRYDEYLGRGSADRRSAYGCQPSGASSKPSH